MDNNALITTAVITGIIAVLTMVFKSVRKIECWKDKDGAVCCDFDTRTVRSSSSTLDTVIEQIPVTHLYQFASTHFS